MRRAEICTARQFGANVAEIAAEFKTPESTVKGILRRSKSQHDYASQHRSGRPKSYSDRDVRKLLRIVRREPKTTYQNLIKQSGVEISKRTCARLLEEHNIKKWVAQARPKLTEEHARERLAFARKYEGYTAEDWRQFVFSDECSVERGTGKARDWVFRTPQQKWDPKMLSVYSKGKGVSVMVWAAIYDGCKRSELVIMERDPESKRGGYSTNSYIATLEQGLLPIHPEGMTFQQDGASIHTSRKAMAWFADHRIELLKWPPYSPDLNPIEHMWWHLKRAVYDVNPQFDQITGPKAQHDALVEVLPQAWAKISDQTLGNILESMPRRIQAVLAADGWQTKY